MSTKLPWDNALEYYERHADYWFRNHNFYCYSFMGDSDEEFFQYIKKEGNVSDNSKVLDLGCGSGYLTSRLSDGNECLGISNSPSCVSIAKARFPRCHFALEDMQTFQKPDYYDNILAIESFGHSLNVWETLKNIYLNLREGGWFFIKEFFPLENLDNNQQANYMHWLDYYKYSRFTLKEFLGEARDLKFKIVREKCVNEIYNESVFEEALDSLRAFPEDNQSFGPLPLDGALESVEQALGNKDPFPDDFHYYMEILLQK